VTLGSPSEGAFTSSTPTFTWSLGTGEEAEVIEISTNPAPGGSGGFTDDDDKHFDLLDATQLTYVLGDSRPLFAGTWYWHVRIYDEVPCCDSRWSAVRSFQVRDEPIIITDFGATYFSCLREVAFTFSFSDNSQDQYADWAVIFSRTAHGAPKARFRGTADQGDYGSVYESRKRPRSLKIGKRYFSRVVLTDRGGNQTQSGVDRVRIAPC